LRQNGDADLKAIADHSVEGGMWIDACVKIVIARHPKDREFKSTLPLPLQPIVAVGEPVTDVPGDDHKVGLRRRLWQVEITVLGVDVQITHDPDLHSKPPSAAW
jgi:hypothetical protein